MKMIWTYALTIAGALAVTPVVHTAALAQDDVEAERARIAEAAQQPVDTSRFEAEGPYRIGLSAGYLDNSWILFASKYVEHEAAESNPDGELIITDAGWNPAKQAADIEDLISRDVDLILFWPVDEAAMLPALQKAAEAGIPTVNVGYNFMIDPAVTANAYVDQWDQSVQVAERLCQSLDGTGRIFAMLPIAGSSAAVTQLAALESVLESDACGDIELASVEYGDWNRAKAKQLTENLLQRFARIDGVFSPAGQMSMGVVEAFDEAGRLDEVTMSPGDEYNGWLKMVAENGEWGSVTSGLEVGSAAVRHGLAILRGEDVQNAVVVGTQDLTPEEAAEMYQPERPDDWWPTDLPEEFLPQ